MDATEHLQVWTEAELRALELYRQDLLDQSGSVSDLLANKGVKHALEPTDLDEIKKPVHNYERMDLLLHYLTRRKPGFAALVQVLVAEDIAQLPVQLLEAREKELLREFWENTNGPKWHNYLDSYWYCT